MLRLNPHRDYATIKRKRVPGNPQGEEADGLSFYILISNLTAIHTFGYTQYTAQQEVSMQFPESVLFSYVSYGVVL